MDYELYTDIGSITWCHTFSIASNNMAIDYALAVSRNISAKAGQEFRLFNKDKDEFLGRITVENTVQSLLLPL